MSELDLWLKKADADSYCEGLGATKAQALKGYLNGKLPPKEVARKFIEGFDLEIPYNRHFREILTYLIPPCYETSDSHAHRKIVKLMVAMRNLRYSMVTGMHSKREMDLRKETDLKTVLCELGRSSKNVINSVRAFCHPWILLPYRANTRILGLWCEVLAAIRHDCPLRPASNMEWINLNTFIARLAASDVCSLGPWRVKYLCDSFLKDEKVREDVLMLNVAVSAAVQHMIYSASKGFELSEENRLRWQEWKEGFEEAQKNPLIDSMGKRHAKLSVAAMNEAELGWNRCQVRFNMGLLIHDGSRNKEIQATQEPAREMKRGHDVAFSNSSAKGTERNA